MTYLEEALRSELPVANLYSQLGYFTRFHLNIYPTETTMQLSDIDVFAIRFDSSLMSEITIVEVKEESNKFSDLFKLYGFKSYYGDCRAIFVTKKVHPRIIPVAKKLDINLISFNKLKELAEKGTFVKAVILSPKDGMKIFENLLKIKDHNKRLYWEYNYLWLEKDPFRRFYQQQKLFKESLEYLNSESYDDPFSWFRRELFILGFISLVEITSNCITIEDEILGRYIETKFMNIDMPADTKMKVKEGVETLIQKLKELGMKIDTEEIEILPKYLPNLEKLIKIFTNSSSYVQYYININENICRLLLQDKPTRISEIAGKETYKYIHNVNDLVLRILHSGPINYDFEWFI